MSKLICIQGNNKGDEFALIEGENLIGRGEDCGITVFDRRCSRHHLKVYKTGRYYGVEDLDSSNGSFINRRRMAPQKRIPIVVGDKIRIGNSTFELSDKAIGGIIDQTATEVDAEMCSLRYSKMLRRAAKNATHHHAVKKQGLFSRIKSILGG